MLTFLLTLLAAIIGGFIGCVTFIASIIWLLKQK